MITASIVLYYTKLDVMEAVIRCLNDSPITKIYVLDNSESSELRDYALSLTSKVEYIHGHGNIGYGKAHNIALKRALELHSRYHLIINPDISFEKETIENLVNFMDTHEDVGSCMPDVVYPDGQEQYLCKLLPTPLDMFGRRLLPKKWMVKRNYKFEMRETGYDRTRNIPLLSGCFMFLRMSVIEKVGLFDDQFFLYFEDYDLTRRIHQVNKTVFYPEVKIVHNHAHEHRGNRKLLKISIKSAIQYFNKWGWIFDNERKQINKSAFSEVNVID